MNPIRPRSCLFLFLFATVILGITGCAGGVKMVKVTGTLKKKGVVLQASPATMITLHFIPIAGGHTYPARVKGDQGTYEAEMPVGSYNVKFILMDTTSKKGPPKPRDIQTNLEIKTNQSVDLEIGP